MKLLIPLELEPLPSTPEPAPEPKCPECGSGVNRQKCAWELGGSCPRHEVRDEWEQQQRPFTNCTICGGAFQGYAHDARACRDRLLSLLVQMQRELVQAKARPRVKKEAVT